LGRRYEDVTKFCTLTFPRSGSTWFMSLLHSHPQIGTYGEQFLDRIPKLAWYNELFLPGERFCQFRDSTRWIRPWSTFRYLETLIGNFSGEYDALGFKLMYQQLLRKPEILLKMALDRYRVIHLVRENHLDVWISGLITRKRGKAHSKEEIDTPMVHLDPSLLLMRLKSKERVLGRARFILRILPLSVLEVTYESLRENTEETLNTVASFLSTEPYTGYESPFKKISTAPDWERIENYEEVKRVLAGTEFEGLLGIQHSSDQ
jgi:hypothetical protein